MYAPGFGTEYTENYCWDKERSKSSSRNKDASGLFDGNATQTSRPGSMPPAPSGVMEQNYTQEARDPTQFQSEKYPSIYRETVIRKDDRGKYIDPYKNIGTKPYGRRLMYDDTHPDKIYASQWSSELADEAGPYSFPTTTELDPEIPWTKDMQWKAESQVGQWPTDQWKNWTAVGECPTYDGHDDQVEYHKYKVQVP